MKVSCVVASATAIVASLSNVRAAPVSGPAPESPYRVTYDNHRVLRVNVPSDTEAHKLNAAVEKLGLSKWNDVTNGKKVDLVVPPQSKAAFDALGFKYDVMHSDLAKSMQVEREGYNSYVAGSANLSYFNAYHDYSTHLQFMTDLHTMYPNNTEVLQTGKSYQGNQITALHFWGKNGKGVNPAVILHSTVHAREWIATMVNEYAMYQLLTNYANSTEIASYVDKYDFYIFPVVNPDGFIDTNNGDRLFRKNRQPNSGSSCIGTDINRNAPFAWGTGGASTNQCDDDYQGTKAASAPETVILTNFIKSKVAAQGVKLYIDWHSYSQLFMFPWGYECSPTKDQTYLASLAKGAVTALEAVHGTSFTSGEICPTIYQASGSTTDYAYGVTNVTNSFAVELRDTGNYGFVLPPNQIMPSAEEAFAAVKYLLKNIK